MFQGFFGKFGFAGFNIDLANEFPVKIGFVFGRIDIISAALFQISFRRICFV